MAAKQLRELSRDEVAKHNKPGDLWTIIDSKVFDLSKFADLHPGGKSVLLDAEVAGLDSTQTFYGLHRQEVLARPQYARLQIGSISGESVQFKAAMPGDLSAVPYGEPQWLTSGFFSPYFKESHYKLREAYRKIMDEVIIPEAIKCEASGQKVSQETVDLCAKLNINAMRIGPGKHLQGRILMNGIVKPEEFDYFHELVINQESARAGMRGFIDGFLAGMVIGVPPILNYGTPELINKIVPDVLAGKKYLSLAISEAFAGSDVAGLKCTAKLTEDKKHWIVTGTKKWITNGHFSDYFSTACNTGKGLTMILIPRGPGVETKPIKTAYSPAAGTAYITFDHVKVPVENTLGEVDKGLKVVLSNFNHERWMMCCVAVRTQRKVVEESFLWANQRQVFGKSLLEQAVIRNKLAQMVARVESGQTWLENITYQMNHMTYNQMSQHLAGPIGLLKAYITRTGQETARDATQIFGGRGITQSGLGSYIEHYHRTVPFDAILGGAEDVLFDLGVKQAMKSIPPNVRL